jgi:hypothetical protein
LAADSIRQNGGDALSCLAFHPEFPTAMYCGRPYTLCREHVGWLPVRIFAQDGETSRDRSRGDGKFVGESNRADCMVHFAQG